MKSHITELKQQVHALLREIERLEAKELEEKEVFPLAELKERVTHYVKENDITIDTFCDPDTLFERLEEALMEREAAR